MLRHKFEGKEGNNISISISPDLEEGEGSGAFHLRGKFALRNGPGRERGEAGTAQKDGDGDWDNTNTVGGK